MEMLIIVVVSTVIVLIVLSLVAVLICRKIHQNRMQRLHARDAENGAIDGLIASNVGDSTLAVTNFYNFYNSLKSLLCKYEYLLQMLDLDGLDYMVCISLKKNVGMSSL